MATTVTRYVDPNSSGGNGTTNALSGANAAYASLSAWNTARARDLVVADEIERVICSSDDAGSTHAADTTAVTIDGWTTDATRYIQIEAASSHGGKYNSNIYRYQANYDWDAVFIVKENYVNLIGLQIANLSTNTSFAAGLSFQDTAASNSTAFLVDKCILYHGGLASLKVSSGNIVIRNSLIYGSHVEGIRIVYGANQPSVEIDNCTVVANAAYGINNLNDINSVVVKNTYSGGNSTSDYNNTFTFTTCASSDATAGGTAGDNIAYSTANFTNVTAGSEDLHLPAGSALINVGTDLSATFTDDIDGQTRTGTWDIGADEYVAAAAAVTGPFPTFRPDLP